MEGTLDRLDKTLDYVISLLERVAIEDDKIAMKDVLLQRTVSYKDSRIKPDHTDSQISRIGERIDLSRPLKNIRSDYFLVG